MRRAKASKSQSPSSTPTGPSKTAAASLAQAKLQLRPLNPKSLEEAYKVSPEGLERAFYVPDFVTPEEEAYILDMVCYLPLSIKHSIENVTNVCLDCQE